MNIFIGDTKRLNDPELFQTSYNMMDKDRQAKIDRFRFKKDKILSLGAGLIIRKALLAAGLEDAKISVSPSGKPYIRNNDKLFFSVSHSGTKVLCAFGGFPIGCDIERIGEPSMNVAKRTFSEIELKKTIFMDAREFKSYYFKIWTGKESYLKMTGEGLTRPLNNLTILVPYGCQIIGKDNDRVSFIDIDCGKDYQGTVCTRDFSLHEPIYTYNAML